MQSAIHLEVPTAEIGMAVNQLVADCAPLDPNSVYCNLLQCDHFAQTSVAALLDQKLVGFISGYRIPPRPNTLFVWQVAVGKEARGQGLAGRMLQSLLARAALSDIRYIETTITESNEASWALFRSLANRLEAPLESTEYYSKDRHFKGVHDSEMLVRIGPFNVGTNA